MQGAAHTRTTTTRGSSPGGGTHTQTDRQTDRHLYSETGLDLVGDAELEILWATVAASAVTTTTGNTNRRRTAGFSQVDSPVAAFQ